MRRHLRLIALLFLAFAPGLASAAALPPAGQDMVARPASILPVTPGVTYRVYGGTEFRPRNSGTQYATDLGRTSWAGGPSDAFVVRLDLPQGAQITELLFLYVDNSPANLNFFLTR